MAYQHCEPNIKSNPSNHQTPYINSNTAGGTNLIMMVSRDGGFKPPIMNKIP